VSFVMQFGVGGVHERLGTTGIAHLLEHMLFKGTDTIGTHDYAAEQTLFAEMDELHDRSLEARALGDLKENAEYHAAKEKQSHIAGRIAQIDDRIARAQVIDPSGQEPDRVRFGATVLLEDTESGEEVTYRIVGEDESDAGKGLISLTSPVARALMNKEPDDEVRVVVGAPIDPGEIAALRADATAMMEFLRRRTYELSPVPLKTLDYGFEFEDHHRK